jgi:hypothetical protein
VQRLIRLSKIGVPPDPKRYQVENAVVGLDDFLKYPNYFCSEDSHECENFKSVTINIIQMYSLEIRLGLKLTYLSTGLVPGSEKRGWPTSLKNCWSIKTWFPKSNTSWPNSKYEGPLYAVTVASDLKWTRCQLLKLQEAIPVDEMYKGHISSLFMLHCIWKEWSQWVSLIDNFVHSVSYKSVWGMFSVI